MTTAVVIGCTIWCVVCFAGTCAITLVTSRRRPLNWIDYVPCVTTALTVIVEGICCGML